MKRIMVLIILSAILPSCSAKLYSYFIKSSDVIYETDEQSPSNTCTDLTLYIPDTAHLSHFPMKYVRVNVHFLRNPEDENHFDMDIARKFVEEMIGCGNYKLYVNAKMNLPKGNETERLPVRYRYKLTPDYTKRDDIGVYIHEENDPKIAYFFNSGPDYNVFDLDVFEKYGIRKKEVLNVFVLSHPPDSVRSGTYRNKLQGVGYAEFVKVAIPHNGFSSYNRQFKSYEQLGIKYCGLLNHEIGHSLGLRHTWNANDGCDDTPQNPGCWSRTSSPPCEGAISNNMMDYNAVQDAITPCQLYNIFYRMADDNKSQRGILEPGWCTYKPESKITIRPFEDVIWKTKKDLEGDVVIENNGQLTIYCRVSLPSKARVLVKAGGTLIIDRGMLTNVCDEQWEGVEIIEKKNRKGKVILKNGGKIENTINPLN